MAMDARAAHDAGVDIRTAARVLGLTIAATRKRVLRGSLDAYKVDGRWRVVLPVSHAAGGDGGQDSGPWTRAVDMSTAAAARIAELEAEVLRLWRLVEAQQATIVALSARPALPASDDRQDPAPETAPPSPSLRAGPSLAQRETLAATIESPLRGYVDEHGVFRRRPWWVRWLRGKE